MKWITVLFLLSLNSLAFGQCQWYTVTVPSTTLGYEIQWQLLDEMGVLLMSGGSPYTQDVCLPDGCYTLLMYDTGGNGWQDEDWFIVDWIGEFDWDSNIPDGYEGFDLLDLGGNGCSGPFDPGSCPANTTEITLDIGTGSDPTEIEWDLVLDGMNVVSGEATYNETLCLPDGCYFLFMNDDGDDGWEGANYSFLDALGGVLQTGTMVQLSNDTVLFNLGGLDCTTVIPELPPAGSCGDSQPTSDCSTAPCICDPYVFNISPSGFGAVNEIPCAGTVSNPAYNGANIPPWGGTDTGCLLAGELNSNWMTFTVETSGTLEFTIGAGGEQIGYYDWAMWPYDSLTTCAGISSNTLAPVRCVWNAVSWGGTGVSDLIPMGGNAGNYAPSMAVTAGESYIICISNWSYVNATVTFDFTGTATIACSQLVLPVSMLDFEVSKQFTSALLDWHTLSETNNDHFEIERSTNMQNWEHIGDVNGMGNSSEIIGYDYLDRHPHKGWNYYRLRQIDFNGTPHFSEVKSVFFDEVYTLEIYPNPANTSLVISTPNTSLTAELQIIDAAGRLVKSFSFTDQHRIELDVSDWAPGMYIVEMMYSDRKEYRKLVVNHLQ